MTRPPSSWRSRWWRSRRRRNTATTTTSGTFPTRSSNIPMCTSAGALAGFSPGPQKPVHLALPRAPEKFPFLSNPDETLAYWLSAASGTAATQQHVRWESFDEVSSTYDEQAVMPAVYFVIGQTA